MGIFGIAMPLFNIPSTVIIQERVEESYLGRVYSVLTMLFTSAMPMGMLLFGPLAEVVKIEKILLVTGSLMIVQSLLMLLDKQLMSAGIRAEK